MKLKITLFLFLSTLFLFQAQAQCNGATFEEKNGIAVIEMETASLPSSWKKETASTPFTGSSYIAWRGADSFSNPLNGIITYKVKINSTGTYRFIWRNKVGIIANHPRPSTEHNDSWLKIVGAADFWAQKGTSKVYPKGSGKTPTAHGSGSNGFFKVYASGTTKWTWSTNANDENPHQVFVRFGSPGVYTIQVGARSKGHFIDRMVLYKENQYSASAAQSLSRGQTNCGGGSPPPPPPPSGDPAVTSFKYINANNDNVIGTLNNGAQLNLANIVNNLSFSAIANSDTGSVRMVLTGPVSNTRVDNNVPYSAFGDSGGNYTGKVMKVGSYTLKAVPFSGDNASGTKGSASIINFTIINDSGDPPPPPPSGNNAPTVSITNPKDGQNFSVGSNVSVTLSASDSDGSIVKHEIFVNGSKVDTDGSKYTPHPIKNMAKGNYAIRAKVTDNDGKTAETTVNITVGSSTPPPPPPSGGGSITFKWINSNTNSDIRTLKTGSVVTGSGSNRNIRADATHSNAKSAFFRLSGPKNRTWTENAKPYALFGDTNGNYASATFPNGTYTLTADIYSGSNRTGSKLDSKTITFEVAHANASKSIVSREVYVYPNPIENGRFSVKLPEDVAGDIFYSLVSSSGASIETGKLNVDRAGDSAEFNLDSFNNKNNGVYYLILQSNVSSYTVPIVKK